MLRAACWRGAGLRGHFESAAGLRDERLPDATAARLPAISAHGARGLLASQGLPLPGGNNGCGLALL
eukprot:SAG31_NODE_581_length_13927_cov_78.549899_12_plen_67_part_00